MFGKINRKKGNLRNGEVISIPFPSHAEKQNEPDVAHVLPGFICLVSMLQRGNPGWYAFPRWSVGTRKREPLKV